LILRYEINCGNDGSGGENDLLQWVRSKIPSYNIQNFQGNWNDGRAVCALVDALVPGLCPDHKNMDPNDKLNNATRGINTAERNMNIQPLITPEEMNHAKVDKHAVMTYIAQFRRFQPSDYTSHNDAQRCSAYGPGLQEGSVGNAAPFTVEVPSDIKTPLVVRVEGPSNDAKVVLKKRADGNYDVSYNPTEPGEYKVHVTLAGNHIPGSVFYVTVLDEVSLGGEGKIRVYYSTTSSSEKTRRDINSLRTLLEQKRVHLRADFEPWIPVDVAMTSDDIKQLFAKAGNNMMPMVFVDDKYVGDYDRLYALAEDGELDKLLNNKKAKFITPEEHEQRMRGEFSFDAKLGGSIDASASAPKRAPVQIKTAPAPAASPSGAPKGPTPSAQALAKAPVKTAAPAPVSKAPAPAPVSKAPAPAPVSKAPAPDAKTPASSNLKFCTECGTKATNPNAKFCLNCGIKF
jgi:hypothetical protein